MRRILVTGATGFLGRAIVDQLDGGVVQVRTTGRDVVAGDALPGFQAADLISSVACRRVVQGVDVIVHAAGTAHRFRAAAGDDAAFRLGNVQATVRLADAAIAAGVQHFVFVSSVAVYGESAGECPDEMAECRPTTSYGASKLEAERRLIELADQHGMRVTILRPVTLYGEGDPGNVGRLIGALDRRKFVWIGTGRNRKSLLHRDDAARACLLAAGLSGAAPPQEERLGCERFNVTGPANTMREIVDAIRQALGHSAPLPIVPALAARTAANLISGFAPTRRHGRRLRRTLDKWLADDSYDGSRFARRFGFQTKVSLVDGMIRQVQWYRREGRCAEGRRRVA